MNREDCNRSEANELRKKAEEILQEKATTQLKNLEAMSPAEIRQILHELQVHQIELEIQNEELRQAQSELETARARYYDLYDLAPVSYCTLSRKGVILKANLAAANLLQTPRSELVEQPLSLFILPEEQDVYYLFRKRLFKTGQPQMLELRMQGANETPFWAWIHATIVEGTDGEPTCRIVLNDITERKEAEEALQQREQRQRLAAEIASDFLNKPLNQMDHTLDDTLATVGKAMGADRSYIFVIPDEEQSMQSMSCKHKWYAPGVTSRSGPFQDRDSASPSWMYGRIHNQKPISITNLDELPTEATDDREVLKKLFIQSLLWVPMVVEEQVMGFIGVDCIRREKAWDDNDLLTLQLAASIIASAIKRDRAEKELLHLTFHDQLTGLFNRTYFKAESKRLDVERQLPISIIMGDVNGLKLVNDTFGHDKGDKLLKQVAGIFRKTCRDEDIITRWGGDEFVILLPQTGEQETRKICDRIREKSFKTRGLPIPLSIALGYAVKENPNKNLHKLMKEAEEQMYKNKLTKSRSAKGNVLKALRKTLESKSHETEEHSWRLQRMALKIGEEIGLPAAELDRLFLLVILHDIGKTSISEEILVKPHRLKDEEWKIMKKHPERGYRIASATDEFAHVANAILHHHERWDGKGYPEGLQGEDIPLLSRITTIVDAYDAMTNNRPYNPDPKSHAEAVAELKDCAGSHFDPELVEVFLRLFAKGKNIDQGSCQSVRFRNYEKR